MRLRHIEVIQALLQTAHVGTAAEMLQLPVTEIERVLREAEDQLGFMLFASVRGRLQATREARLLQVQIANVYSAFEPVQRLAESLRQYHAPPLRVIGTPPLAYQLLPGIMLETQNNNLGACRLYERCGYVLGGIDHLRYRGIDPRTQEVALFWYRFFDEATALNPATVPGRSS